MKNQSDKLLLYECLEILNETIKGTQGQFNSSDSKLKEFLEKNDIILCKYGKRSIAKVKDKPNYFVYSFDSESRDKTKSDNAHDLLRHIRNSIAHSLVDKIKKSKGLFYFKMRDKNKCGNETMLASIRTDLLKSLIEVVKNAKR